ncbi:MULTISPECIES: hypothetical protein [unclassified Clostridioides]|uniref:hypothetical protein n=1 Tax=unclassified Clostridioides TaxID=2635829 RepID=UPI001D10D085|nr:hypothetical protein [Clostridioides sp. ES-S-0049-03]MCC0678593.1 hypothetical protein [Clostridioides sp. ES-W-0018-02]MCC0713452.1 hypothetical protein [Clostridioides sp. ES-W-0017-02]
MIDRVNLYKKIELDCSIFSLKLKKNYSEYVDYQTGEIKKEITSYSYYLNGIRFLYAIKSKKIYLYGRLIMLLKDSNHVYNLDDVYLQREEIRDKANSKLKELFNADVDILDFNVSSIEVNFNVYNVNANLYIELFNQVIKDRQDKRYVNYVDTNKLAKNTSVYIKSKHNFKSNRNKTYTLNFYNKLDQLYNLRVKANEARGNRINISENDLKLAENTLRLEVKYGKDFRTYFNDIFLCRDIVLTKYKRFICSTRLDFYDYFETKKIVQETNKLKTNSKKKLLQYLELRYAKKKKYSKEELKKYFKMLEFLNIAPALIPTIYKINKLQSPIKLLDKKIENLMENASKF